jgi:small subunit ribosomal protein S13
MSEHVGLWNPIKSFLNLLYMLVIFGVTLVKHKRLVYALTDLYGIGLITSKSICSELGFSPILKVKELTEEQQFSLSKKIKEEFRIEENLKDLVKGDIRRMISNGSVRGFRHRNKLPVRGQRTHTNAKTARRVILGMAIKNRQNVR